MYETAKRAKETLRTLIPKEMDLQASSAKWYSMRILPYRTLENVIDGVVITFIDITQQVEHSAAARRLATVLNDSSDAVTVLDLNGTILDWNKSAEVIYGYTKNEALKMNIRQIVPKNKQIEIDNLFRGFTEGKETKIIQTQHITKDSRLIDTRMTITKLVDDDDDKIIAISTTTRSIIGDE